MLGALAEATSRVPVTTAVTCPTMRIHPAVFFSSYAREVLERFSAAEYAS